MKLKFDNDHIFLKTIICILYFLKTRVWHVRTAQLHLLSGVNVFVRLKHDKTVMTNQSTGNISCNSDDQPVDRYIHVNFFVYCKFLNTCGTYVTLLYKI
jgi:hypothetical protein